MERTVTVTADPVPHLSQLTLTTHVRVKNLWRVRLAMALLKLASRAGGFAAEAKIDQPPLLVVTRDVTSRHRIDEVIRYLTDRPAPGEPFGFYLPEGTAVYQFVGGKWEQLFGEKGRP